MSSWHLWFVCQAARKVVTPTSMDREDHKPCLESPLIQVSQEALPGSRNRAKREEILGEVKKQLKLAGPLMSVNLLICSLQMISLMFVGHLGELALSGASMATSFASVTGFSLLVSNMGSSLFIHFLTHPCFLYTIHIWFSYLGLHPFQYMLYL